MSLLTNPHVNTFVHEFGLDGFDENSRFDLELFIDMVDLLSLTSSTKRPAS